jgi:hypothetical protein
MTSNPWPSSDWVTFLSERGAVALAILGLALLALLVDGVRALRAQVGTESRLSVAVLLATIAILVAVGTFDAVLLLPAPALIGWSLLGALAAPSRERRVIELTTPRRIAAFTTIAILGALVIARSVSQAMAMSLYATTARGTVLERASAIDPGSYRIHVRLAQLHIGHGDCVRARVHADAAKALFPSSPTARRLAAVCGGSR